MKKININLKLLILGLLLMIPAILPFFDSRMFTFHDETQIANIYEYNRAISLGQFPPRWASEMHFEYGSPFPEFNYQLPYYLTNVFSNLGLPITWSFKMTLVLSVFLGFLGFYFLAHEFATPQISFLAALIYTYTPYRAVNLFVRGTLGESLAFAVFPFVLLFLFKLIQKQSITNVVWAGLAIATLILTHQPAAILVLPLIYLLVTGYALVQKKFKAVLYQILSGVIALFIAAYYWLPVIAERGELASVSPFNFYDHFPFIKQLIYSPWGYGGSNWGPYDDFSLQLGIVNLLIILSSVAVVFYFFYKKKFTDQFKLLSLSLLGTFIALFLMNIRSSFFWQVFPFTQEIQFPWRLLMATSLFTSLSVVFLLKLLPVSKKILRNLIIGLSVTVVALNALYFRPGDLINASDSYYLRRFLPAEVLLQDETVSPQYLLHSEDYVVLPKNAHRPDSLPEAKVTSLLPDTQIEVSSQNPLDIKAKINAPYPDKLTIHTFYFPGWTVILDNRPADVDLNYYGAMTIDINSGMHELEVVYQDTQVRYVSNIISSATLIGLAALLCLQFIQTKNTRGKRTN